MWCVWSFRSPENTLRHVHCELRSQRHVQTVMCGHIRQHVRVCFIPTIPRESTIQKDDLLPPLPLCFLLYKNTPFFLRNELAYIVWESVQKSATKRLCVDTFQPLELLLECPILAYVPTVYQAMPHIWGCSAIFQNKHFLVAFRKQAW